MAFIFVIAFIAGLFMYLLPSTNAKVTRIGEMLLFSCILSALIAVAPTAVAKLFH